MGSTSGNIRKSNDPIGDRTGPQTAYSTPRKFKVILVPYAPRRSSTSGPGEPRVGLGRTSLRRRSTYLSKHVGKHKDRTRVADDSRVTEPPLSLRRQVISGTGRPSTKGRHCHGVVTLMVLERLG